MPTPIPRMKIPPIRAIDKTLKMEGLEAGGLSLVSLGSVNLDLLRFIVAYINFKGTGRE